MSFSAAQAQAHGIQAKMATGDNLAIAREIAGQLGLEKIIYAAEKLMKTGKEKEEMATDTACAATSQVFTAPGLSVIINAVEKARQSLHHHAAHKVLR